jgi:hypothetical protein
MDDAAEALELVFTCCRPPAPTEPDGASSP